MLLCPPEPKSNKEKNEVSYYSAQFLQMQQLGAALQVEDIFLQFHFHKY
jgi:hypothetical protein